MKAIVWTAYGSPDVLKLREVPKPAPAENELLIRVRAATVTAGDSEARQMKFPSFLSVPMRAYVGLRKPRRVTILGQEVSGDVEAVGSGVTRFRPGNAVVAATLFRFGAYAEYVCLPESNPILVKPGNMTYDEAATIPTGGMNAFHFVRKAALRPGDHLLINGAGGSIGTYAIQIAKAQGAAVTAVDSGDKLDLLLDLGADHVVDYTRQDFTRTGAAYDAIIDVVGKSSFTDSLRCLNPNGRYVLGNSTLSGMMRGAVASITSDKQVTSEPAGYKPEDMRALAALIETDKVRAVIDRRFPLAQTAEAHRYVDSGRKAGNVIITVGVNG